MPKHLHREIENLKKMILALGARVEENVFSAVRSLEERNRELAETIIEGDTEVDHIEVDVEEECLKVLALYQPVAGDLRLIVSFLKINSDLERIGDLAVNIAERAFFLASRDRPDIPLDFMKMVEKTREMLRKSLDALVNRDAAAAHEVMRADDDVDSINREMYTLIQDAIRKKPDQVESLIHLLSSSRHLERIADHATSIAEDGIDAVDGEIVRHQADDYSSD